MAASSKKMSEDEWALLQNIGELFKEMRTEKSMTQRQAAKTLGTCQARLPVLENGQADVMITTLHRWARLYGYELEIAVIKLEEEDSNA